MANQQQALSPEQLKNFNKPLEDRITEAVKEPTKWKKVLPDLMTAEVFTIAQVVGSEATGDKRLNLMMLTNAQGQEAIPFFTSPARLSVLANPQRNTFNCMKITTLKLFQMIKGKTAVLNPGSECGKMFTPFEINLLVMENKDKLSDTMTVKDMTAGNTEASGDKE